MTRQFESSPSSSDRNFGFVFAVFFLIVAMLPLLHGHEIKYWAAGLSVIFGVLSLLIPAVLAPLNYCWYRFGMLLHNIVSPITLAVLFYCVVMPTGLMMRLLGKDPLRLRFDHAANSYWIERTPPGPDAESLKNQF